MAGNELEAGMGAAVAPKPPREAPGAPPEPSLQEYFAGQSQSALARYEKLAEADKRLKSVREELDRLLRLGDMISEDDVVEAGAGLVAAGLTAPAVAGLLADMPETPAALQSWVQQHDQQVKAREAQLDQVLTLARHELALTGFKSLAGRAMMQGGGGGPPSPSPALPPSSEEPPADAS